ncbi:hypothetical protein [Paraburkholderia phytofirmans]|nr:hypothetical protein [Paraburkholderia phytofirmans]
MNTKNSSSSKTGSGTTESGKDRGSAAEAAKDASAPAQAGGPAMATVVDVTSADLKSRFVAGSIPLQQDFGNLIDIAECGRRAVGQSKDQTDNNVGAGLALASDAANIGKLSVKPAPSDGIKVDDGGLKIRRGGCITVDSNGIAVKAGNGIDGSSDYVCVKAGYGIVVDSSGVSIDSKTVLPKGMIMMFCGSTIPQGWVRRVSRYLSPQSCSQRLFKCGVRGHRDD